MSTSTLGLFLRHLALSEEASRLGATSDHNLLAAYELGHSQAAFTELMRRHGPMVLRTCRRILGHGADAEDAFQATFILLSTKAGQLRKEVKSLGGWLHHVACQTALNVLRGAVRRGEHERQASVMTRSHRDPSVEATWNEIRPILDTELDALPDDARRLLIACYLEEKTYREVEEEFGLPRSSVARHLERARGLLAKRLARRGITVSATLLAALLGEAANGAGVPAILLVHTMDAARAFTEQAAGRMSANVTQLVESGLAKLAKGSTYLKLWSVLGGLLLLVGGTAGLTVALVARPAAEPVARGTPPSGQPRPPRPAVPRAAPLLDDPLHPMLPVAGRVLDAGGKPVPFAAVTALVRRSFRPGEHGLRDEVVAQGKADKQGAFCLRVPAHFPTWFPERQVVLVAESPGRAPRTTIVRLAERGATNVDLSLTAEQVVRGRLLTPDGAAAAGVRLRVIRLGDVARETVQGAAERDGLDLGWPGPVTSDAEGSFTLSGIDPEQGVWLQVEDDRYAPDAFGLRGADKPTEIRLKPAQVLDVRVIAADTGKAIAGVKFTARLPSPFLFMGRVAAPDFQSVSARVLPPGSIDGVSRTDGYFRLRPPAGPQLIIEVHPPADSPYLPVGIQGKWQEGVVHGRTTVVLPRGVVLRGRVVDEAGRPVADSSVQFGSPELGNSVYRTDVLQGGFRIVRTDKDGRFRLTVPAGPVRLMVHGPTHEYRAQPLRYRSVLENDDEPKRWGWRAPLPAEHWAYTHAQRELTLTVGEAPPEVRLRLVRGQTVAGRVVGPDGAPVQSAVLLCGEKVSPLMNATVQPLPVRGGRYELPGCVAGQVYPVFFLDAVNGWGAAVDLTAGRDGGPEVKLARCGSARLRLVDDKGRPQAGRGLLQLALLIERSFPADKPPRKREVDAQHCCCYDPRHYYDDPQHHRTQPASDGDGWLTLPALIPGARYVLDYADVAGMRRFTPEFEVKPGEQLLLPDLAIQDQP
jgi:RNA polymerase sigma factor (sigma-70 family)